MTDQKVDQSRGGSYIDDGSGPVHVDDLPKGEMPEATPEAAPVQAAETETTSAPIQETA